MLFQEAPEYEQNFSMVMRVLEYAEVREEDEGHVSPLDLLFESIERRKPDSVAVRQYKVFKLAAGKTAKSILVSTACLLYTSPFAGSGTTVLAAVKEGYDATGIEVTDVYADLARKRLEAELNAA